MSIQMFAPNARPFSASTDNLSVKIQSHTKSSFNFHKNLLRTNPESTRKQIATSKQRSEQFTKVVIAFKGKRYDLLTRQQGEQVSQSELPTGILQEKESKKMIEFENLLTVIDHIHLKDMTECEIIRAYYTRADFEHFREECERIGELQPNKTQECTSDLEQVSRRGLARRKREKTKF